MPWRPRPRAASLVLLSAGALIAESGCVRSPDALARPSIDETLTRDAAGCAGVSSAVWHPLSGLEYTGRLHITMPPQFGGAISLYVGDTLPLDLEALTPDDQPVVIHQKRMITGPGVLLPPDFWLEDGSPLDAPRHVSRLLINASGEETRAVTVSLGRRAPRVLARLVGYSPAVRVPVCADAVRGDEIYFATGWFGQTSEAGVGPVRWMRQHGAILVASKEGHEARVRVRIAPAVVLEGEDVAELRVRVNDTHDLAPIGLRAQFQEYELMVPDSAWVTGTNELLFSVSPIQKIGRETRGLALASLHVQ